MSLPSVALDSQRVEVEVGPTRHDILHPCDIMEVPWQNPMLKPSVFNNLMCFTWFLHCTIHSFLLLSPFYACLDLTWFASFRTWQSPTVTTTSRRRSQSRWRSPPSSRSISWRTCWEPHSHSRDSQRRSPSASAPETTSQPDWGKPKPKLWSKLFTLEIQKRKSFRSVHLLKNDFYFRLVILCSITIVVQIPF